MIVVGILNFIFFNFISLVKLELTSVLMEICFSCRALYYELDDRINN